ncbi:Zn2/Cys6 DNA-binding protein [Glarea lozoyensis ATCC 20868]|uniref:Zn2/Cys6 DNA-binding protein n=1 Tax=Glarea lozoyensis (strain ATCC 20868 / MF5171) TaxID=1116229 RepID=S3D0L4_GLAL2|nr:Zn2/Cys6 DNA-binding protein [Glarea lozoyensis ATCC 20868]EPE25581.1 Zn2/Cys6 DNA-binding protein [Glarea lozoyensis ATCC 20868]
MTSEMRREASNSSRDIERLGKAMRKGTRSCYECRRRKVRCIFGGRDSTTCDGCASKGKACIEQRRELLGKSGPESKDSLRERIAKLEAIIEASRSDNNSSIDGAVSDSRLNDDAERPYLGNHSPQSIDPIVTLFDNAIWRRRSTDLTQERSKDIEANPAAAKRTRIRDSLLSSLISSEILGMILNATCSWWHTWRAGPRLFTSVDDLHTSTLQDFVLWALESSDPSIVGLAMLCIAICLQHLDSRVHQFIIRKLPRLPGEIFQDYFESVDRLVLNDPDCASTGAGIEATILSATIHMNLGMHRNCWMLVHRAIAYSHLLGFHRPERLTPSETEAERNCRTQGWLSVCSRDVYMSLLLGLPYAADGRTIPFVESQHNARSLLHHKLIILSVKVIDRNQMGLGLSVSHTDAIQKEIEAATKDLDDTFWNAPAALACGKITQPEYLESISAQCWLHQLLALLHMPLMIHSVEDKLLEKHRIFCLEACRNLLRVHHIMRSDASAAFSMVKLIDYQAFICSTLLILGLLGYGDATHQLTNRDKDRDLIGLTVATLRQASGTVNNPIASQAVQGLETLLSLDSNSCATGSACVDPHARIVVPHIGTITITPGKHITETRSQCLQPAPRPPPEFSLTHNMYDGSFGQVNQPPIMASSNDLGFLSSPRVDEPSIDIDWTSATMPNFENDWAWLNDLNF